MLGVPARVEVDWLFLNKKNIIKDKTYYRVGVHIFLYISCLRRIHERKINYTNFFGLFIY